MTDASLLNAGSLHEFCFGELDPFTKEYRDTPTPLGGGTAWASLSVSPPRDFRLYRVGVDDVHDILKYVLSRVKTSLYLNMFGYDDEELNSILMALAHDPSVLTMYTLDKSQSGGVHEKAILASDAAADSQAFNAHFAIGQSATHQITHTKGWVADGCVGGEGSTNWSTSGEGTFVVTGQPGGGGYKAQNNTQTVFTTADDTARFQAELISEHMVAVKQGNALEAPAAPA